uniref:Uncharacterized protein n=1 Tax=Panagrolaimus sp. ES5 TaxID=591445 RepID=A0AC34GQE5_9BILA
MLGKPSVSEIFPKLAQQIPEKFDLNFNENLVIESAKSENEATLNKSTSPPRKNAAAARSSFGTKSACENGHDISVSSKKNYVVFGPNKNKRFRIKSYAVPTPPYFQLKCNGGTIILALILMVVLVLICFYM